MKDGNMAARNLLDGDNLSVSETKIVTFSFQWTIKNYKSHIKQVGNFVRSATFSAKNEDELKCHLVAFPKGTDDENKDFLALYLRRETGETDTLIPVPTLLELSLINRKSGYTIIRHLRGIHENNRELTQWGANRFVNTSVLLDDRLGWSLDDCVTIMCKMTLPPTETTVTARKYSLVKIPECPLKDNLENIFKNEQFSDVILSASGKQFKAHKVVLAAMSPVFAEMFSVDLKEKKEGIVEIADMESDILENMLKFVYTGKIELENVQQTCGMLAIADKYGIERLKVMCEDDLSSKLTVENAAELLVFACLHNARYLKEAALDFSNLNIVAVRKTKAWETLITDHPRLLDELLARYLSDEE